MQNSDIIGRDRRSSWESPWTQYFMAALTISAVTLLRLPFESALQGRAPYAFYFPILAYLAWSCRLGTAIFGIVLSCFCAWYFLSPQGALDGVRPVDTASHLMFLLSGGVLVALARTGALVRRGAMSALQESEDSHVQRSRLAAIVESSDDAIVGKDLDGIVQTWNEGAERLFGYTAQEMVGRSILTLIPHERRFEEDHILMRLRRGERVDHFETVRRAKDGRELDVSLSVSPIRNAAGEIVGASKIARDVTDRKRAAQAIAEQREWLRVTLASVADGVITTDRAGAISYMNVVAERLTGIPLDEAIGKPLASVLRLIDEKTRQPIEDPCAGALHKGGPIGPVSERLLLGKDGREYPIEDNAAPIVDDRGATLGVVVGFRDVSERRRAEQAIAEQREWFETTLVSIGDAVVATDIRGRVTFLNPVAEHMTGWKRLEAEGCDCATVFNIVNEHTRAPVENPVARVLREGAVVGLANHTLLIGRDGREYPIDDSAAPIRGLDGRITGAVLVFHDIAERRRAELERQSAERERESLLQSERAARAEAERASRLKDQFLATVSHELRTPLNAILGWADVLKRTPPDAPTLARGLSIIERNARIQSQLVSDLLDVSRIVSGKLTLELQLTSLADVVDDALETVRSSAEAKGVRLRCEIDHAIEPVVGDPARLQQVVWNLLANAVKFTPKDGDVSVEVTRDGESALISVRDTGAGIRAEFLPYLFERFRQGDSSTTRRFGGLGLGLTIVKQLVELHGGTISAHSDGEGKGASFEVRIPLDASQAAWNDEHAGARRSYAPAANAQATRALLDRLRVVVVEDEPDARELVERLLSEAGCKVVAVGSASEALEALEAAPMDLLISDIGLPGEDGYTLMQRIRAHERVELARVPAVALTAFARGEDRGRALRSGFQAHLTKPVDPAELLATVASFASIVNGGRR